VKLRAATVAVTAAVLFANVAMALTFVRPAPQVRLVEVKATAGGKTTTATPNMLGTADPKYLGSVTTFSDDRFAFTANVSAHGLLLLIENKGAESAKVLWEDGAFIDEQNASHPLRHESRAASEERGKRILEDMKRRMARGESSLLKEEELPPSSPTSVIIAGTQVDEWVHAADLVGKSKKFLFPTSDSASPIAGESAADVRARVEEKVAAAKGNKYRYLIPIRVGDERREYLFTFVYEGAEISVETR
ncbi:MAG TPA: hypothetical protein VEU30_02240, partial [Thermoanaerobaculia bacterium]|nr:hypothetical protein [Thermoanaerobaculia bacterium]